MAEEAGAGGPKLVADPARKPAAETAPASEQASHVSRARAHVESAKAAEKAGDYKTAKENYTKARQEMDAAKQKSGGKEEASLPMGEGGKAETVLFGKELSEIKVEELRNENKASVAENLEAGVNLANEAYAHRQNAARLEGEAKKASSAKEAEVLRREAATEREKANGKHNDSLAKMRDAEATMEKVGDGSFKLELKFEDQAKPVEVTSKGEVTQQRQRLENVVRQEALDMVDLASDLMARGDVDGAEALLNQAEVKHQSVSDPTKGKQDLRTERGNSVTKMRDEITKQRDEKRAQTEKQAEQKRKVEAARWEQAAGQNHQRGRYGEAALAKAIAEATRQGRDTTALKEEYSQYTRTGKTETEASGVTTPVREAKAQKAESKESAPKAKEADAPATSTAPTESPAVVTDSAFRFLGNHGAAFREYLLRKHLQNVGHAELLFAELEQAVKNNENMIEIPGLGLLQVTRTVLKIVEQMFEIKAERIAQLYYDDIVEKMGGNEAQAVKRILRSTEVANPYVHPSNAFVDFSAVWGQAAKSFAKINAARGRAEALASGKYEYKNIENFNEETMSEEKFEMQFIIDAAEAAKREGKEIKADTTDMPAAMKELAEFYAEHIDILDSHLQAAEVHLETIVAIGDVGNIQSALVNSVINRLGIRNPVVVGDLLNAVVNGRSRSGRALRSPTDKLFEAQAIIAKAGLGGRATARIFIEALAEILRGTRVEFIEGPGGAEFVSLVELTNHTACAGGCTGKLSHLSERQLFEHMTESMGRLGIELQLTGDASHFGFHLTNGTQRFARVGEDSVLRGAAAENFLNRLFEQVHKTDAEIKQEALREMRSEIRAKGGVLTFGLESAAHARALERIHLKEQTLAFADQIVKVGRDISTPSDRNHTFGVTVAGERTLLSLSEAQILKLGSKAEKTRESYKERTQREEREGLKDLESEERQKVKDQLLEERGELNLKEAELKTLREEESQIAEQSPTRKSRLSRLIDWVVSLGAIASGAVGLVVFVMAGAVALPITAGAIFAGFVVVGTGKHYGSKLIYRNSKAMLEHQVKVKENKEKQDALLTEMETIRDKVNYAEDLLYNGKPVFKEMTDWIQAIVPGFNSDDDTRSVAFLIYDYVFNAGAGKRESLGREVQNVHEKLLNFFDSHKVKVSVDAKAKNLEASSKVNVTERKEADGTKKVEIEGDMRSVLQFLLQERNAGRIKQADVETFINTLRGEMRAHYNENRQSLRDLSDGLYLATQFKEELKDGVHERRGGETRRVTRKHLQSLAQAIREGRDYLARSGKGPKVEDFLSRDQISKAKEMLEKRAADETVQKAHERLDTYIVEGTMFELATASERGQESLLGGWREGRVDRTHADIFGRGESQLLMAVAIDFGLDVSAGTGLGKSRGQVLGAAFYHHNNKGKRAALVFESNDSVRKYFNESAEGDIGANYKDIGLTIGIKLVDSDIYLKPEARDAEGRNFVDLYDAIHEADNTVLLSDMYTLTHLQNNRDIETARDLIDFIKSDFQRVVLDEAQKSQFEQTKAIIASGERPDFAGKSAVERGFEFLNEILDLTEENTSALKQIKDPNKWIEEGIDYNKESKYENSKPSFHITADGNVKFNRAAVKLLRRKGKKHGFTRFQEFQSLLTGLFYKDGIRMKETILKGRVVLKPANRDAIHENQQSSDVALQIAFAFDFLRTWAGKGLRIRDNATLKTKLEYYETEKGQKDKEREPLDGMEAVTLNTLMDGIVFERGRMKSINVSRLRLWFDIESIGRLETKIGTPIQRLYGRGTVAVSATLPEFTHLFTGNEKLELGQSQSDLRYLQESQRLLGIGELNFDLTSDGGKRAFVAAMTERIRKIRHEGKDKDGNFIGDGNFVFIVGDPVMRELLEKAATDALNLDAQGKSADYELHKVQLTSTADDVGRIAGSGKKQRVIILGSERIAQAFDLKRLGLKEGGEVATHVFGVGVEGHEASLLAQALGRDRSNQGLVDLWVNPSKLKESLREAVGGIGFDSFRQALVRKVKQAEHQEREVTELMEGSPGRKNREETKALYKERVNEAKKTLDLLDKLFDSNQQHDFEGAFNRILKVAFESKGDNIIDLLTLNVQFKEVTMQSNAARFVVSTLLKDQLITKNLVTLLENTKGDESREQKLREIISDNEEGKLLDIDSYETRKGVTGEEFVRNEVTMIVESIFGKKLEGNRRDNTKSVEEKLLDAGISKTEIAEVFKADELFAVEAGISGVSRTYSLKEIRKQNVKTYKVPQEGSNEPILVEKILGRFSVARTTDRGSVTDFVRTVLLFSDYIMTSNETRRLSSQETENQQVSFARLLNNAEKIRNEARDEGKLGAKVADEYINDMMAAGLMGKRYISEKGYRVHKFVMNLLGADTGSDELHRVMNTLYLATGSRAFWVDSHTSQDDMRRAVMNAALHLEEEGYFNGAGAQDMAERLIRYSLTVDQAAGDGAQLQAAINGTKRPNLSSTSSYEGYDRSKNYTADDIVNSEQAEQLVLDLLAENRQGEAQDSYGLGYEPEARHENNTERVANLLSAIHEATERKGGTLLIGENVGLADAMEALYSMGCGPACAVRLGKASIPVESENRAHAAVQQARAARINTGVAFGLRHLLTTEDDFEAELGTLVVSQIPPKDARKRRATINNFRRAWLNNEKRKDMIAKTYPLRMRLQQYEEDMYSAIEFSPVGFSFQGIKGFARRIVSASWWKYQIASMRYGTFTDEPMSTGQKVGVGVAVTLGLAAAGAGAFLLLPAVLPGLGLAGLIGSSIGVSVATVATTAAYATHTRWTFALGQGVQKFFDDYVYPYGVRSAIWRVVTFGIGGANNVTVARVAREVRRDAQLEGRRFNPHKNEVDRRRLAQRLMLHHTGATLEQVNHFVEHYVTLSQKLGGTFGSVLGRFGHWIDRQIGFQGSFGRMSAEQIFKTVDKFEELKVKHVPVADQMSATDYDMAVAAKREVLGTPLVHKLLGLRPGNLLKIVGKLFRFIVGDEIQEKMSPSQGFMSFFKTPTFRVLSIGSLIGSAIVLAGALWVPSIAAVVAAIAAPAVAIPAVVGIAAVATGLSYWTRSWKPAVMALMGIGALLAPMFSPALLASFTLPGWLGGAMVPAITMIWTGIAGSWIAASLRYISNHTKAFQDYSLHQELLKKELEKAKAENNAAKVKYLKTQIDDEILDKLYADREKINKETSAGERAYAEIQKQIDKQHEKMKRGSEGARSIAELILTSRWGIPVRLLGASRVASFVPFNPFRSLVRSSMQLQAAHYAKKNEKPNPALKRVMESLQYGTSSCSHSCLSRNLELFRGMSQLDKKGREAYEVKRKALKDIGEEEKKLRNAEALTEEKKYGLEQRREAVEEVYRESTKMNAVELFKDVYGKEDPQVLNWLQLAMEVEDIVHDGQLGLKSGHFVRRLAEKHGFEDKIWEITQLLDPEIKLPSESFRKQLEEDGTFNELNIEQIKHLSQSEDFLKDRRTLPDGSQRDIALQDLILVSQEYVWVTSSMLKALAKNVGVNLTDQQATDIVEKGGLMHIFGFTAGEDYATQHQLARANARSKQIDAIGTDLFGFYQSHLNDLGLSSPTTIEEQLQFALGELELVFGSINADEMHLAARKGREGSDDDALRGVENLSREKIDPSEKDELLARLAEAHARLKLRQAIDLQAAENSRFYNSLMSGFFPDDAPKLNSGVKSLLDEAHDLAGWLGNDISQMDYAYGTGVSADTIEEVRQELIQKLLMEEYPEELQRAGYPVDILRRIGERVTDFRWKVDPNADTMAYKGMHDTLFFSKDLLIKLNLLMRSGKWSHPKESAKAVIRQFFLHEATESIIDHHDREFNAQVKQKLELLLENKNLDPDERKRLEKEHKFITFVMDMNNHGPKGADSVAQIFRDYFAEFVASTYMQILTPDEQEATFEGYQWGADYLGETFRQKVREYRNASEVDIARNNPISNWLASRDRLQKNQQALERLERARAKKLTQEDQDFLDLQIANMEVRMRDKEREIELALTPEERNKFVAELAQLDQEKEDFKNIKEGRDAAIVAEEGRLIEERFDLMENVLFLLNDYFGRLDIMQYYFDFIRAARDGNIEAARQIIIDKQKDNIDPETQLPKDEKAIEDLHAKELTDLLTDDRERPVGRDAKAAKIRQAQKKVLGYVENYTMGVLWQLSTYGSPTEGLLGDHISAEQRILNAAERQVFNQPAKDPETNTSLNPTGALPDLESETAEAIPENLTSGDVLAEKLVSKFEEAMSAESEEEYEALLEELYDDVLRPHLAESEVATMDAMRPRDEADVSRSEGRGKGNKAKFQQRVIREYYQLLGRIDETGGESPEHLQKQFKREALEDAELEAWLNSAGDSKDLEYLAVLALSNPDRLRKIALLRMRGLQRTRRNPKAKLAEERFNRSAAAVRQRFGVEGPPMKINEEGVDQYRQLQALASDDRPESEIKAELEETKQRVEAEIEKVSDIHDRLEEQKRGLEGQLEPVEDYIDNPEGVDKWKEESLNALKDLNDRLEEVPGQPSPLARAQENIDLRKAEYEKRIKDLQEDVDERKQVMSMSDAEIEQWMTRTQVTGFTPETLRQRFREMDLELNEAISVLKRLEQMDPQQDIEYWMEQREIIQGNLKYLEDNGPAGVQQVWESWKKQLAETEEQIKQLDENPNSYQEQIEGRKKQLVDQIDRINEMIADPALARKQAKEAFPQQAQALLAQHRNNDFLRRLVEIDALLNEKNSELLPESRKHALERERAEMLEWLNLLRAAEEGSDRRKDIQNGTPFLSRETKAKAESEWMGSLEKRQALHNFFELIQYIYPVTQASAASSNFYKAEALIRETMKLVIEKGNNGDRDYLLAYLKSTRYLEKANVLAAVHENIDLPDTEENKALNHGIQYMRRTLQAKKTPTRKIDAALLDRLREEGKTFLEIEDVMVEGFDEPNFDAFLRSDKGKDLIERLQSLGYETSLTQPSEGGPIYISFRGSEDSRIEFAGKDNVRSLHFHPDNNPTPSSMTDGMPTVAKKGGVAYTVAANGSMTSARVFNEDHWPVEDGHPGWEELDSADKKRGLQHIRYLNEDGTPELDEEGNPITFSLAGLELDPEEWFTQQGKRTSGALAPYFERIGEGNVEIVVYDSKNDHFVVWEYGQKYEDEETHKDVMLIDREAPRAVVREDIPLPEAPADEGGAGELSSDALMEMLAKDPQMKEMLESGDLSPEDLMRMLGGGDAAMSESRRSEAKTASRRYDTLLDLANRFGFNLGQYQPDEESAIYQGLLLLNKIRQGEYGTNRTSLSLDADLRELVGEEDEKKPLNGEEDWAIALKTLIGIEMGAAGLKPTQALSKTLLNSCSSCVLVQCVKLQEYFQGWGAFQGPARRLDDRIVTDIWAFYHMIRTLFALELKWTDIQVRTREDFGKVSGALAFLNEVISILDGNTALSRRIDAALAKQGLSKNDLINLSEQIRNYDKFEQRAKTDVDLLRDKADYTDKQWRQVEDIRNRLFEFEDFRFDSEHTLTGVAAGVRDWMYGHKNLTPLESMLHAASLRARAFGYDVDYVKDYREGKILFSDEAEDELLKDHLGYADTRNSRLPRIVLNEKMLINGFATAFNLDYGTFDRDQAVHLRNMMDDLILLIEGHEKVHLRQKETGRLEARTRWENEKEAVETEIELQEILNDLDPNRRYGVEIDLKKALLRLAEAPAWQVHPRISEKARNVLSGLVSPSVLDEIRALLGNYKVIALGSVATEEFRGEAIPGVGHVPDLEGFERTFEQQKNAVSSIGHLVYMINDSDPEAMAWAARLVKEGALVFRYHESNPERTGVPRPALPYIGMLGHFAGMLGRDNFEDSTESKTPSRGYQTDHLLMTDDFVRTLINEVLAEEELELSV